MMILPLLSWWYSTGWAKLALRVGNRMNGVLEAFSVGLLLKTLFAPFRQIDAAGTSGKSLDAQLRAFGDKLFSRVFGAFIRSMFIIFGTIAALLVALVGLVQLLMWPLVPLLPLIGIVVALTGWTL